MNHAEMNHLGEYNWSALMTHNVHSIVLWVMIALVLIIILRNLRKH